MPSLFPLPHLHCPLEVLSLDYLKDSPAPGW
ncbi:MAG: hypothetical protein MRECE_9c013 [Mycoplasmataceae bacterium CE_OT135]|nr:MAG: hypothetical protein MRECE_9c013 [Mycoplasmataceae bacterium CE_OT135]